MSDDVDGTITNYLQAMADGNAEARSQLWEVVYEQIHGLAQVAMRRERPDHTLDPTELVHEAYHRLVGGAQLRRKNRNYFYKACAEAMKRILVEYARRHRNTRDLVIDTLIPAPEMPQDGALDALGTALDRLKSHDRDVYDVVMLRFFAGQSVETTAEVLNCSDRTVKRHWRYGRTWLYREIAGDDFDADSPAERKEPSLEQPDG